MFFTREVFENIGGFDEVFFIVKKRIFLKYGV